MTILDTRIPAGLDANGMSPDERRQYETLRAHRALGLLMQRIPVSASIGDWTIRGGRIEILTGGCRTGHAARAKVLLLAEQFGLTYAEKPHINGRNHISASGVYAEASVEFWDLVEPCACEDCGGVTC